jgi:hypothetical protein
MQPAENLVRKQYYIESRQVAKLENLAKQQKKSAAEVVRMAIDAFNPDVPADLNESELLELVSKRVKEAIKETKATRKSLRKTLSALGVK